MKKLSTLLLLVVSSVLLVACGDKAVMYDVTFDTQGGNSIASVEVEKGKTVARPADPTKTQDGEALNFEGWFDSLEGTTPYDWTKPVTADLTLYARWSTNEVINFDTRTTQVLLPAVVETGEMVQKPADPTRAGYKFGGWFTTKRGLTWLEPEAVSFPFEATESVTLYAYWEPISSKAVNYSEGETYTTAMVSDTVLVLNPTTYRWGHESDYMDLMATALYETEVDWDKAIADGVADFAGDFSKIENDSFSIDALDYRFVKLGAVNYPIDANGDEHLDENGNYDRQKATTVKSTEWTFNLNPAVKFEDGTPVTAAVWEYTLKQFLDKEQNNYRANSYYKTTENKNGFPILNAFEYFKGEVTWDEVGFEILSDYSFKITSWEEVSQSQAVGFGEMHLVHPDVYESSLTNGINSTYGTPKNPYVSYGEYILKTWDENAKLVFNKNFDYVAKGTINYKSQVVEIVDNIDQQMALFENGKLSATGLNKQYYAEYVEDPNLYRTFSGYPQNIMINLADSKKDTNPHIHPSIMFDKEFRQALLYGFNRVYYANNVYAPNIPSFMPMPSSAKVYLQDPLTYAETPQHLQVLQDLGIQADSYGYVPEKAKQLFDTAYAKWVAEGNTGAVKLRLIADTSDFGRDLTGYLKQNYEDLFGSDKLVVEVFEFDAAGLEAEISSWNFDLYFGSVGFGSNSGAIWQYPFIGYAGALGGGGALGMTQPFDDSQESGYGIYWETALDISLPNVWDFLVEEDVANYTEEQKVANKGYVLLYDQLKATETKAEGVFQGTIADMVEIIVFESNPFDGTAAEPFTGAASDAHTILAAFERVFLEYAPIIPAVTRSGATVYAENVVIEWPKYSVAFSWGSQRYRYLNTDADFQ